ncbi:coiled-coil domain-containing protein 146 [Xenopus laevis]|uniref:Coiled-coil domain-containing protein 146 n=2 Tax=Xenopus laevis TaxID=8355 RepID=A0A1L8GZ96_XENLA|nr:coiled-coil domain-containing protein 146 [Xenopus laevis]XP_018108172.1 coiled-coil domain-containing protein 146 [Xenopus laevis]OCT89167.1 hypothetical protein XELAEV_18017784mg [Xenopus laevis]
MSSLGEEKAELSDSSTEEEEEGEEKPLYPIAPSKAWGGDTKDISASIAFQYLDELSTSGKISGTKSADLKDKYTLLYQTLKRIQESEVRLLQDAKRFTNQLEQQDWEKSDQLYEGYNTEISRLREQLLKYNNDINEAEEREYSLQYKLECLQEEKKLLVREYDRMPKAGDYEKRIKILQENIKDLQKENTQRRMEIKALKEDLETKQRQMDKEQREIGQKLEQQEVVKHELVQLSYVPQQIGKETEKINRRIVEAQKRKNMLEKECQVLNDNLKQMEHKARLTLEEKEEVMKELEGKRTWLEAKEQECNHLTKLLELAKENEAVALGERAAMDLSLRHAMIDKQTQHDALTRKTREKERDLRNTKKMELHLKSACDAIAHTQNLHEKIKAEVDCFPKADALIEKRKELRKEVEVIRRQFAQQQTLTELEAHTLEQCIAEEEQLVKEQSERREELVNLTRLVQIKAEEREQKSRDLIKAKQRYQQVLQEVKGRHLIIGEHKKKNQDVQKRLKEFAKMYDIIRNERNKCVSLIQTAMQRASELREKIKIIANEMEILRNNVVNKDRQLQKIKLKENNNQMVRDSLQKDLSRVRVHLEELKEKREQQKMQIGRLTNMINQAEVDMVQLQEKYQAAVQNRNERGVQLIEREEEICIFFEKINTQEMILRNGDLEMVSMDEKMRFLQIEVAEKKRQVEQLQKSLPNKRILESDLVTLQIQLSQCNDKVAELEKQTEDPGKEYRIRLLEGKDPSLQELMRKTEELELHLAQKEEQLLEKDLLYEQVSRLTDQIHTKAENGKLDTLLLSKKMNELHKKIKNTTKKMMSQIAELSMQQANSIKLQEELRNKVKIVETCYTRMEQGLPPSEETEIEWKKMIQDKHRRQKEKEQKARMAEEEEQHLLPNGAYTTAEQRPNAYIPEDETALPLPRPYGILAPFKPSETGSNMRHIRKPIVKPIEI